MVTVNTKWCIIRDGILQGFKKWSLGFLVSLNVSWVLWSPRDPSSWEILVTWVLQFPPSQLIFYLAGWLKKGEALVIIGAGPKNCLVFVEKVNL